MATATEQVRALEDARVAMLAILRLEEIRSNGNDLTFAQDRDYLEAQRGWNAAADLVPELPRYDHSWSDEEASRAAHALRELTKYKRGEAMYEESPVLRSIRDSQFDSRYNAGPSGRVDAIRSMWTNGVTSQEFDLVPAFETRAIADFSDGTALYTNDFSSIFAAALSTESPWFQTATVVRANNGRPLVVPGLTADVTTYTPGEGTAITESSPTLAGTTITPVSYKALTYVSQEAFEDTEYDLMGAIAQSHARSIALAAGSDFTTTVLAGITNGGTATGLGGGATATFFGYEDLLDLAYGRAAPYRQAGTFVMANGAIKKSRKFTDINGQYLWGPALAQGQPGTLDGRPVLEDPYLSAVGSASTSVVFGDLRRGLVIKASPLRVAIARASTSSTPTRWRSSR